MRYLLILLVIATLTSCAPNSRPIEYGKDKCDDCKMAIVDNKWGAELVTEKGKVYTFDSIECLVAFLIKHKEMEQKSKFIWTVDYNSSGEMIDARTAFYIRTANLSSPMGLNIGSFKKAADRDKYMNDSAKVLNYQDLAGVVKEEWY